MNTTQTEIMDNINDYMDSIATGDPRVDCPDEWALQDDEIWNMRDDMQPCPRCTRELPATVEYFGNNKASKTGLASRCKVCNNTATKEYSSTHHDQYVATIRACHEKMFNGMGLVNDHWITDGIVNILAHDKDGNPSLIRIDEADLESVKSQNTRWIINQQGYAARADFLAPGRECLLHRVIAGVKTDNTLHTDHIDRDRLNNRRNNIRVVTASVNIRNSKQNSRNTSGYPGVVWKKADRRWQVQIRAEGKTLGKQFKDFSKACEHARNIYIALGTPACNLPPIPVSPLHIAA